MSTHESGLAGRVVDLRHEFDRTFAEPPRADTVPTDDFLALSVGGDPYVLRLAEVAGLLSDRKVTWLPGSIPELLGLVGLRGALLPVFDLRALLGYPTAAVPRWLLVVAHAPVALAFEQFVGHLRVPRESIAPAPGSAAGGPLPVREVVRTDGLVRPIVHLPSVLETIAALARQGARPKE